MPLIAALTRSHRSPLARRGVVAGGGIAIAAAVSVATLSMPWLGHAVSKGISESLHGVETVAAMLAERSPGARPEGALVNLKHKRQAVLHEHGLPKIRSPYAPPTAYQALAAPPPIPPIAPSPQAPLYSTVAGVPPIAVAPANGGAIGGPPVLSEIPTPGGGGGGGSSHAADRHHGDAASPGCSGRPGARARKLGDDAARLCAHGKCAEAPQRRGTANRPRVAEEERGHSAASLRDEVAAVGGPTSRRTS